MQTKIEQYRGVDIYYDPVNKVFIAQIRAEGHDNEIKAETQTKLEEAIARFQKRTTMPIEAIEVRFLEARKIKITSAVDSQYRYGSGVDVWITHAAAPKYQGGPTSEREKTRLENIFKITPENLAIMESINTRAAEREALQTEIEALVKQLKDPVTKKDIGFEEAEQT